VSRCSNPYAPKQLAVINRALLSVIIAAVDYYMLSVLIRDVTKFEFGFDNVQTSKFDSSMSTV